MHGARAALASRVGKERNVLDAEGQGRWTFRKAIDYGREGKGKRNIDFLNDRGSARDQPGQESGPGVKHRDRRAGAFGQHHQGRFGVLVGLGGVIPVVEHLRNRAQKQRGDDQDNEHSHAPVPHSSHFSLR